MGCLEDLPYDVILSNISITEASKHLEQYSEYYDVESGFKIAGVRLIGNPTVRIAIDGDTLIFPFTKPCLGTFLVRVNLAGEEIESLRNSINKKRK